MFEFTCEACGRPAGKLYEGYPDICSQRCADALRDGTEAVSRLKADIVAEEANHAELVRDLQAQAGKLKTRGQAIESALGVCKPGSVYVVEMLGEEDYRESWSFQGVYASIELASRWANSGPVERSRITEYDAEALTDLWSVGKEVKALPKEED